MAIPFFETVEDLQRHVELVRRRRYGVIDVRDGKAQVHFRPWPKMISLPEVWWDRWRRERTAGAWCRLYFNEPVFAPGYLTLPYVVTTRDAGFATLIQALAVLDEIAKLKHSAGIVCEVTNIRISHRALERCGWSRHLQGSHRRHYIKRLEPSV